ncbi:hypothetical protein SVIOM342S_09941 [Streptomyces violaceorubidus]
MTDSLLVDLARVEPAIETVILAASSDGGRFGQVPDLYIEVRDATQNTVVARFDNPGATVETAFVLGGFYRRQGVWKFRAVGQGYDSGGGPGHGLRHLGGRTPARASGRRAHTRARPAGADGPAGLPCHAAPAGTPRRLPRRGRPPLRPRRPRPPPSRSG